MALQVVSMEQLRMEVVLEPERTGDSVAEVCRRRGISRETFYVYRRRYLSEGLDGLVSRSRRPRGSPARINPELEAAICRLRTEHPAGAPAGPGRSSDAPVRRRRRSRRSTGRCSATD